MSYLPLAWIGMAVFAAALTAPMLAPDTVGMIFPACGGLALCAFLSGSACGLVKDRERRRILRLTLFHAAMVLLAAGALFGLYSQKYSAEAAPYKALDGLEAQVRMEPLDYPAHRYGKYYYPVRVLEVDGEAVIPFQVRLSCSEALNCEPMDQVLCQLHFYAFDSEGMFSSGSSRLAEGSVLGAYPIGYGNYSYEYVSRPIPQGRILPLLRRHCARLFDRCLPRDEAGLLQAALLGQRSKLPQEIYTDFQLIGCSHMLSLSGLHMTMLGSLLSLLLDLTPLSRRLRPIACTLILFLYLALTGFPVSALRSYLMFAACSLASVARQVPHTLNSLGAAVTFICFSDPFSGGSVGFALSVMATAGIAVMARPLAQMLCPGNSGPLARYAAGSASTSIAATLFTLPIQIAVFRGLPLLTVLSNLLLLPLFTAALYSALPLMALMLAAPSTALIQPFVLLCGLLCRLLLRLSRLMAGIPGIYLSLADSAVKITLLLALAAIALLFSRPFRAKRRLVALLLVLTVLISTVDGGSRRGTVTLAVSGEGKSACVVLISGSHAAVLSLGTFNSGLARQIIAQKNIHAPDSVLISGGDYNSLAMARDIIGRCRPETVLVPEGRRADYPGVSTVGLPEGGTYQPLPGVLVQVDGGGSELCIWAYGKKLLLAGEDHAEDSCDLLITGSSLPQVKTGMTLFMCGADASPADAAKSVYSDHAIVTDQSVTYVDIFPDGRIELCAP